MATEEQIEALVEEAQGDLDDLVADTAEYTMEDALEFWEQMHVYCESRMNATRDDIRGRDG